MSQVTDDELRAEYVRAPEAGLELGLRSNRVYGLLQTKELEGLFVDGKWFVTKKSIQAYKRRKGGA